MVVFGVMKDKDYSGMIDCIAKIASFVIAVAPVGKRALAVRQLYTQIVRRGIPCFPGGTVRDGLTLAAKSSSDQKPILVTGSHLVVGEAIQFLEGERT